MCFSFFEVKCIILENSLVVVIVVVSCCSSLVSKFTGSFVNALDCVIIVVVSVILVVVVEVVCLQNISENFST